MGVRGALWNWVWPKEEPDLKKHPLGYISVWCLDNPTVVAAVIVTLTFASSYISYDIYFSKFGLNIASVDTDYLSLTLRQASVSLVGLLMFALLYFAVGTAWYRGANDMACGVARRRWRNGFRLISWILLPILLLPFALTIAFAMNSDVGTRNPGPFDPFRARVEKVKIIYSDNLTRSLDERGEYLLIARSSSVTALFDQESDSLFVVPSASVGVQTVS